MNYYNVKHGWANLPIYKPHLSHNNPVLAILEKSKWVLLFTLNHYYLIRNHPVSRNFFTHFWIDLHWLEVDQIKSLSVPPRETCVRTSDIYSQINFQITHTPKLNRYTSYVPTPLTDGYEDIPCAV